MMTVSELFIYRSLNKESRGVSVLLCMFMHNFLHLLEQRKGFAQQIQVKVNLVKYKYEINWYSKPSIPLRQCIL